MRIVRTPPTEIERAARDGPANDEALYRRAEAHVAGLRTEHERAEGRLLLRLARGTLSAHVLVPAEEAPVRRHIFDLLKDHRHVLIVGGRSSGKSALAIILMGQAARRDLGFGQCVPLLVPVSQLEQRRLDENEIDRLNPAVGSGGARFALEAGRALLVIDGVDGAQQPHALMDAIVALAKTYPQSRFVVLTRPLPARAAGISATELDGFVTVRLAAPDGVPLGQVYELDERRWPALRIQRVIEEVDELLDRWSLAALPHGSAFGRFNERGRLLIASALALSLHEQRSIERTESALTVFLADEIHGARWFAETEQLLHRHERARGGDRVKGARKIAKQMISEIRAHPGLIVEMRPGVFGLADLAHQQYLAATYFLLRGDEPTWGTVARYLQQREDRWWHEVIVFAAGLGAPFSAKLPPRTLISALLEASIASDSSATFLAARCAEVASFVPPALKAQIDRRLRAAVPPRSHTQMMHLVDDLGEIAAPALIAALATADANERAYIAMVLGHMDYPPAIRVLARLVGDEERITESIFAWVWIWTESAFVKDLPVGFFAFASFFKLALSHAAADRMFDEVLARASRTSLATFVGLVGHKVGRDRSPDADGERVRDLERAAARFEKIVRAIQRRGRG